MNLLDQDIMYLPGVGPRRKDLLSNELGVATYGDLLEYFPYKYVCLLYTSPSPRDN